MHHHNHYYGQTHILSRYAGFDFEHPPRLRGYLQHGWNIGCGWNPVHEFYDGAWRFTWSDAPQRRGHCARPAELPQHRCAVPVPAWSWSPKRLR